MDDPSSFHRYRQNADHSPDSEQIGTDTTSLIHRAQEGDGQAVEELCARYLPRLCRWASGRLPLRARGYIDTRDMAQDTLINAINRLGGFQPHHPGAFPAYLRKAILNRIKDEVRKTASKPEVIQLDGQERDSSPSPLDDAIGADLTERYENAFKQLKEQDRAAIFLRIEMGMSYKEVAEALGKPNPHAALMAVSRALVLLAKEMSDERQSYKRR